LKILLVEDSRALAEALRKGLVEEGHDVAVTASGEEAIAVATRGDLDVVVLDLGLPDVDGVDVLRRIRGAGIHVPVLVMTARDAVTSRVDALDAGADDYLVKPCAFAELVARLRALSRRAAGPRWSPLTAGVIALGDDLSVMIGDRRIELSPRQHAMLAYLVRRRGEVVTRAELLRDVFGYGFDPGTNLIDVHLTHLRRRLGAGPIRIETIRGAGIRLEVDA
jgi:DNA-binding response OmpR family regulator